MAERTVRLPKRTQREFDPQYQDRLVRATELALEEAARSGGGINERQLIADGFLDVTDVPIRYVWRTTGTNIELRRATTDRTNDPGWYSIYEIGSMGSWQLNPADIDEPEELFDYDSRVGPQHFILREDRQGPNDETPDDGIVKINASFWGTNVPDGLWNTTFKELRETTVSNRSALQNDTAGTPLRTYTVTGFTGRSGTGVSAREYTFDVKFDLYIISRFTGRLNEILCEFGVTARLLNVVVTSGQQIRGSNRISITVTNVNAPLATRVEFISSRYDYPMEDAQGDLNTELNDNDLYILSSDLGDDVLFSTADFDENGLISVDLGLNNLNFQKRLVLENDNGELKAGVHGLSIGMISEYDDPNFTLAKASNVASLLQFLSFRRLNDTPDSFGTAGQVPVVNSDADGLVWGDLPQIPSMPDAFTFPTNQLTDSTITDTDQIFVRDVTGSGTDSYITVGDFKNDLNIPTSFPLPTDATQYPAGLQNSNVDLPPIPAWTASTAYAVGDTVYNGSGSDLKVYTCHTAHTSDTTFADTNWTDLAASGGNMSAIPRIITYHTDSFASGGSKSIFNTWNFITTIPGTITSDDFIEIQVSNGQGYWEPTYLAGTAWNRDAVTQGSSTGNGVHPGGNSRPRYLPFGGNTTFEIFYGRDRTNLMMRSTTGANIDIDRIRIMVVRYRS